VKRLGIIILICLVVGSCKKLESFDNNPVEYLGTRIVAHRGGPGWPYGNFQNNTLQTCIYGFEHADGIEVDVQMSRNNTLWLYHDEFFSECDINKKGRIPAYTDEEIGDHIKCMGNDYTLNTVEDIFAYHRHHQLDDIIILDIKPWLPTQYSNTPGYWLTLAEQIVRLAHLYDIEKFVQVESENALVLNRINKLSDIKIFLTTNCDLYNGCRKALKENYTGISHRNDCHKLTANDVELIHQKGLRIHLWTVNDDNEINQAIADKVDFVQTDNL
jgi:glycerophosphoryl diester phosphodiesterase